LSICADNPCASRWTDATSITTFQLSQERMMDITAMKLAANQFASQTQQPVAPNQDDVDAFARAMTRGTETPDQTVIEALNRAEQHATRPMKDINAAGTRLLEPQEMTTVQLGLAKMSVDLDLAAKVAGSISQGVNKLVTMQ
jgi:type III secretion system YscI/HrpB-like protein